MQTLNPAHWRFCVAPMLDWTDRHCRYFHRQLSAHARLYTEMVTTGAIIHGDRDRLLGFHAAEHPVALQLGGSDAADLAKSVRIASAYGYDEYNLNCGCPSDRVQRGSFGACLMFDAKRVAEGVRAMAGETDRPVTVKHRIGVDERNDYAFVRDFVGEVYEAGCRVFIVHTRSAWLKGLSPKENREVPPLRREVAFALKKDFPDAVFVINGQVDSIELAQTLIDDGMDGVMVGRAAYHNPWMMTRVDEALYGQAPSTVMRADVVATMDAYLREHFADDPMAVRATARHMIALTLGLPGARRWRQLLSDPAAFKAYGAGILAHAWQETFARAGQ